VDNIITIDFLRVPPFKPQASTQASQEHEPPSVEEPLTPAPPKAKPLLLPKNSPRFEMDAISLPKAQFTAPASLSDLVYEATPQQTQPREQTVQKTSQLPIQLPAQLAPQFTENLFPLHIPQPAYPRRARSRGIEGWVKVGFTIQPNGKVKDIVILNAEPSGIFDNATRRSVAQWTFKPQLLDGKPTPRRVEQTIRFNLQR
jgi:periplasmic protein TonB